MQPTNIMEHADDCALGVGGECDCGAQLDPLPRERLEFMFEHQLVRPKVLVESRYAGATFEEVMLNILLTQRACRYAVAQGFNPYASHLFFPMFLDDADEFERMVGIELGLQWGSHCEEAWFFMRKGEPLSKGQLIGQQRHWQQKRPCKYFVTQNNGVTFEEQAAPEPPQAA